MSCNKKNEGKIKIKIIFCSIQVQEYMRNLTSDWVTMGYVSVGYVGTIYAQNMLVWDMLAVDMLAWGCEHKIC